MANGKERFFQLNELQRLVGVVNSYYDNLDKFLNNVKMNKANSTENLKNFRLSKEVTVNKLRYKTREYLTEFVEEDREYDTNRVNNVLMSVQKALDREKPIQTDPPDESEPSWWQRVKARFKR